MHEILGQSLAAVLHDIQSTGAPVPEIRDDDWTDDPQYASAMLGSPDGTAIGVSVDLRGTDSERVARAADQVQEWVIEELWGRAPTNWPPCPGHPHNHPLAAVTRDGQACWVCPRDGIAHFPIGSLP